LGKLLDPLADKILVTGALVALVERGLAPMWMVVVIIAREFLITGLRTIAAAKNKILAAERMGKHKTISQMVVILVCLAYLSLGEFGLGNSFPARLFHTAMLPFFWIALIITVYSGVKYFVKNAAILNETLSDPPEKPAMKTESPLETKPEPEPVAATEPGAPAFKEWEAIVEALGQGAQIILLRKGGIAEGRSGFQAKHEKFWLFPTGYHQQWDKTKPELRRYLAPRTEPAKEIVLQYFAEITDAVYLSSWEQVTRLGDTHFWGEEILRDRFGYDSRPGMEQGLHLLIVRVSRVNLPHKLKPSPDYDGCKSWIQVPAEWAQDIAVPVVSHEEFTTRRNRILAAVSAGAPTPATA
jgi:CDP-diacylglycerol--glycerol-3-phosphate 3-phosphatidyltransferase